jgi:hypothetical protein
MNNKLRIILKEEAKKASNKSAVKSTVPQPLKDVLSSFDKDIQEWLTAKRKYSKGVTSLQYINDPEGAMKLVEIADRLVNQMYKTLN